MVGEIADPRQNAVLLRDDSVGVSTESTPRKIQFKSNGSGEVYYTTLAQGWLEQLNLLGQSEPTLHSLSMGVKPVIVQHPAIIVQPARVLQEAGYDV